ncbi:type ISP restriction/modification enzyme [Treponema primitia]|uniref:type ISP restriction/modification enzyme n=1 Tax=Treponema primitia TaxID=88058 RepID=UPI0018E0FE38|nr:type ISP restriction/modification enzyme [Treponema primitia]
MTAEQFADMYAQTMVYGLFSARCMSTEEHFDPKQAIDAIPSTNPFLQKLLKESFTKRHGLSFDELDLGDITLLLQNTDTVHILEDFNRQTGGGREDPVIYFYEGFLNAYEKEQKKRRGVYYTPQPVVNFMVRAVDDILKTEFGIKDGLASTETKTIMAKGKGKKEESPQVVPAIQILDPATGTGTFLRQIILQIWENFKCTRTGATKKSIENQWNYYVKNHLLPRLNGFELMMAPYAVAHMKLAIALQETGYAFDEDQEHPDRVKVFLTNSLEEADKEGGQGMMFEHDALAEESLAARETKKNKGINVVIGNPPYSGESANKGEWIMSLMEDYKKEPGGVEKLNERNPKWINDDYVKFIRYAQKYIERSGSGIVAYINNHSFLDNPTFRGMRWNLLKSFDKIYIIDLHGNSKKKETTPDGDKDENVFDIQQGVSINIFVKNGKKNADDLAEAFHFDLYGLRDEKYDFLNKNRINLLKWNKISLQYSQYFLTQKIFDNKNVYDNGFYIKNLLQIHSVGIVTSSDSIFINSDKKLLINNIKQHFSIEPDKKLIRSINYRIFDTQYIYYDTEKIERARTTIMRHLFYKENIGLIIGRQGQVVGSMAWNLSFLSTQITDFNLYYRGGGVIFPLYLYPDEGYSKKGKQSRRPNLDQMLVNEIADKLSLSFENEKSGDKDKFAPIDLLDYIYAVLHSPKYRETYKEFLKIDFPRIPYPTDKKVFWKLVALGGELRQLHLLESPLFSKVDSEEAAGKVPVDKPRYEDGKVFINDGFYFPDVLQAAWEFYIGGYQPAQKWLKDRKGQILSGEDVKHYRKIIMALTETGRVMREIDKVGVV